MAVTLTGGGGTTTVRGATPETPPAQPGGGCCFNSTLSAGTVTLASPLAPGASVDARWPLGVRLTGAFRF